MDPLEILGPIGLIAGGGAFGLTLLSRRHPPSDDYPVRSDPAPPDNDPASTGRRKEDAERETVKPPEKPAVREAGAGSDS